MTTTDSAPTNAPEGRQAVRFSHKLEMVGVNFMTDVVRRLSLPSAARFAGGLGAVAGGVFRVRRSTVDRNLQIAFPEKTDAERRHIAIGAYRHLAAQSALLLRMLGDDETLDQIIARVVAADPESDAVLKWVQRRSQDGFGTLILSGHFGNWEVTGGSLVRAGIPAVAVVTRQSNKQFDARLTELRRRLGYGVIPRSAAMTEVPRALRAGTSVMIVADQFTWDGVPIHFFGTPTLAARGPAVFARRAGVPIAFVCGSAVPGSPTRHVLNLRRVGGDTGPANKAEVNRLTQVYHDVLEDLIRRHPDQYLWHHRRWRPLEGRIDETTLQRLAEGR